MDGDPDDVRLLLATASFEVGSIRADPRLAPLPGKRGEALREHLLDLLASVEDQLAQEPDADSPDQVRRAFARTIRQSMLVLRGAHAALPWLAATRMPNVNLGSLYLTEEFARILVGSEVDLVVVPDPEFMYSTTSWPFSEVIDKPRAGRRPIVLNYPLSDTDRLLLHPNFAHELGHASVDEYGMVDAVMRRLHAQPTFKTALKQATKLMKRDYWKRNTQKGIRGTLLAWTRVWVEELLCDHLAVEAAGAAFLWAFAAFALPLTYGQPGVTHPPNTLRLRMVLDHLDHRGWRPVLKRAAPRATAWLDGVAQEAEGPLDPPFGFIRDQLLEHGQILRDAAIERVGDERLDPLVTEAGAEEAADLLDRLILPVGLGEPLEPRAIALGGWHHAFRACHDEPEGVIRALADVRMQELIGKGIEMSVVSRLWEEPR